MSAAAPMVHKVHKVLATAGDIAATIAQIRLGAPLSRLADEGRLQLRLRSFHDCLATDLEWADVLVVQRGITVRSLRLIERMHASGGVVVFEIDDLLIDPPDGLLHAQALRAGQPWLRRALAQADLVSVSTARLGRALERHVRRWVEVPNHGLAPVAATAGSMAQSDSPARTTLVFASSDNVPLAPVATALCALQAVPPAPFEVLAVGPIADGLRAAGVQLQARPNLPRPQFLALLHALHTGAAVIPVGATPFDACKSPIKFFDCALAGLPVLCSARPPYSDVVVHRVNGWLVNDDDGATAVAAWTVALRHAVSAPQELVPMAARAAAEVASRHTLEHTAAAWLALLQGLPTRQRPAAPALPAWQRIAERLALALRRVNRWRLARRAAR